MLLTHLDKYMQTFLSSQQRKDITQATIKKLERPLQLLALPEVSYTTSSQTAYLRAARNNSTISLDRSGNCLQSAQRASVAPFIGWRIGSQTS